MTPKRWRQVKELLHAALTRGESDRTAFLAGACAGDETLQREVESLLAQAPSASRFLDRSLLPWRFTWSAISVLRC